jgi:hypothetical protein
MVGIPLAHHGGATQHCRAVVLAPSVTRAAAV